MTRNPARTALSALALSLGLVMALPACQREKPGEPFALTGKMFIFNYRLSYASYMLTFDRTAPVPDGARVEASFENPMGGAPLTLARPISPAQDRLVLESPDVLCVHKDRPYAVTVDILGPRGEAIQRIETTLVSNLDQEILPERQMVVGPAYEQNPDVFKPGEKPNLKGKTDCPV